MRHRRSRMKCSPGAFLHHQRREFQAWSSSSANPRSGRSRRKHGGDQLSSTFMPSWRLQGQVRRLPDGAQMRLIIVTGTLICGPGW